MFLGGRQCSGKAAIAMVLTVVLTVVAVQAHAVQPLDPRPQ